MPKKRNMLNIKQVLLKKKKKISELTSIPGKMEIDALVPSHPTKYI